MTSKTEHKLPPQFDPGLWCYIYRALLPETWQDESSHCSLHPDVLVMSQMLAKLKDAAEEVLGHSICLVRIHLADGDSTDTYTGQVIEAALSHLGLTWVLPDVGSGYSTALFNEGLSLTDEDDPGRLILVVECNASGLGFDVAFVESGGPFRCRSHHDIEGSSLNEVRKGLETQSRQAAIRKALQNILMAPFESASTEDDFEMPTQISQVLIHGDSAADPELHGELVALLGQDLVAGAVAPEPQFVTAMGSAYVAFLRANDMSYDRTESTWCCLKSLGKGCPTHRQKVEI